MTELEELYYTLGSSKVKRQIVYKNQDIPFKEFSNIIF